MTEPETQQQPVQPDPLDQEIINYLLELQKLGVQITNKEGMHVWFKSKIQRGVSFEVIKAYLKNYKYDFTRVDKIVETIIEKVQEQEQVKGEVAGVQYGIKNKEFEKQEVGMLNMVITAGILSAIAAGTAWFLNKQIAEMGLADAAVGDATGFLEAFVKGGWIIAIVAGFITLLVLTMFISQKYKHKNILGKMKGSKTATAETPQEVEAKMQELSQKVEQQPQ